MCFFFIVGSVGVSQKFLVDVWGPWPTWYTTLPEADQSATATVPDVSFRTRWFLENRSTVSCRGKMWWFLLVCLKLRFRVHGLPHTRGGNSRMQQCQQMISWNSTISSVSSFLLQQSSIRPLHVASAAAGAKTIKPVFCFCCWWGLPLS